MPGMEYVSGRNEGKTGSRLSKLGLTSKVLDSRMKFEVDLSAESVQIFDVGMR